MSPASGGIPPYGVVYSELCRNRVRVLLARAHARGRLDEIAQTLRDIHTRLEWIPLDFGQPLRDFEHLGIKEHIGVVAPLVVKYGVDETRHIVYVILPFSRLPKSSL